MPDKDIILALSQRIDDNFTGLSNRMDDKMDEIKVCVDTKCEAIRTQTVDELHRVHGRINGFQQNCSDSRLAMSQRISQKADNSCVQPLKKEISKLSVHIRWIIYMLITSGLAIGGSAGAISIFGG